MDVIPYAFSFYNKEWLPADWYLNQSIPYRYLFNYPAGLLVDVSGFIPAIFIGRFFSYLLISLAFNLLIKILGSSNANSFFLLAIVVHFSFFSNGIGAGEWMVGGFDTKVFAYAFVLLSFNTFLNGKPKGGWLFAGLALSFHVLIGLYHLICLIPTLIIYEKKKNLIASLKCSPIYLLGGVFGIYSIAFYLIGYESTLSNAGFEAYVNIGVPHHTIPSSFSRDTWIYLTLLTGINLFILKHVRDLRLKRMVIYVLVSVMCFSLGLLVFYLTGSSHYLRYYFFRFADVILPLFTLLMIAKLMGEKYKGLMVVKWIVIIGIGVLTLPKIKHRLVTFSLSEEKIHLRHSRDIEMEQWIKQNTSKDHVFITNPDDRYFYINYERPVFVLNRQSPQSGVELIEWYERLKLLNGGKSLQSKEEVIHSYDKLNKSDIESIGSLYSDVAYVLMPQSSKLDLPVCYKTDRMVLYAVNSKNCL